MLLEEQRFLSEDLERLESAISDRIGEEPKQVREIPYPGSTTGTDMIYLD